MTKTRIAINGFGRIGRNLFRLLLNHPTIEVAAINDIADNRTMSHLIKYDSIHGVLPFECSFDQDNIIIDGKPYPFFHERSISNLDWKSLDIDVVIEATGKYKTFEDINLHILVGAKKVILSAPSETDKIKTVVLGVNEHILDGTEKIISNASCTTNNAAPMIKVINDLCGIEQAYITTVHSYTTDQSLHDQPHKDLRRARGAAQSIVPTTTGAAKALTKIFPELDGKIGGSGIRVPVPDGSLTDITCYVKREVTIEEINKAFQQACQNQFNGIMAYTEDPIVSVDILGNRNSCLFDSQLTSVIDKMVKVVGWYDNEIGYSSRLVDLILLTNKK
ncbi:MULTISPECIES: type I glyceraldehyde-3-phosphate dehydrogenase [Flavobacterium]|jgi:glyceraldehyde 3-phosphate dehydrogenase|uniref:type I glyceraldehyde-3-phosphate dehydrogenase n=1 Tax=Flavobacterium TaxID=237 RepID=UPI0006F31FD0|nr:MULTISPECIES: type I glyceraldehyde-3-phosphate dehydrogenase [Flavobacterium]PZO28519.1 MAG: type I glyceraldehyde-3-phosphate dehydrogenase [Flavobacteriaceae bacterium]PZQ88804.1 MAG: type I glyceraldehyde-3-phosphate dehydrogenase [Flavobacterium johnsoniae]KQS47329.1 glyceraldehyde-3-phosphate dehydrogenase [Flavobacterium sp. Leaf359]MBL7869702.1 type I glyceraldehyde-3-phosphate dehydrogenase [Flavobacterium lindanitolerans]MDQ7960143.1 type I glyceraldehyde-3-phosphate dehydrogenase